MNASAAVDVSSLIRSVNARHGSGWELAGKLAGGYQTGAYELRGAAGKHAVLKARPPRRTHERLRDTARVIDEARTAGWPTPGWLSFGVIPDAAEYIVREFVDDARPFMLEEPQLEMLLAANRVQADLRPRIEADWSRYIWRVVFAGEGGLTERMRGRPETKALLERLERLTAPAREIRLPDGDLVHGDFVTVNVLVAADKPYLIDAEFAGKGTRAYDLATFFFETSVGDGPWLSGARADEIQAECISLIGREGLLVCVTARLLDWLGFGFDHWPAKLPAAVARCHAFLDGLGAD